MVTARKRQHNAWQRKLSAKWRDVSISQCEVKLPGCTNTFLTPAHSRKRGLIETEEQFFEICWACSFCHRALDERMTHEEMENAVKAVIHRREYAEF
jgi:hypothetical protein